MAATAFSARPPGPQDPEQDGPGRARTAPDASRQQAVRQAEICRLALRRARPGASATGGSFSA